MSLSNEFSILLMIFFMINLLLHIDLLEIDKDYRNISYSFRQFDPMPNISDLLNTTSDLVSM